MRKVVVVGAGSGIGAAVAAHFHEHGDHVMAVDLKPTETPASEYAQCDLRDARSIHDLTEGLGSGWDLLAHVAGVPGTAPAHDVLTVNYLGMRLMTESMLPRLRRGGAVVAVASTAGIGWEQRLDALSELLEATDAESVQRWQDRQDPDYPVYTSSKQAVILYAKRLSGPALARYGVRINTVSPGPVETPILPDFERSMGKDVLDFLRSTYGRHGTVDDIVPAIAFLGSDAAQWINGQDVQIDSGFVSSMTAGEPITL
ncbi:coniferyl-alcohol dehydrogenase [Mycolicibacterium hippocampi]|uniref:3-alpha-hydroxysteroid dehydrogenase n=1 Tax=Mycolicibacterium hippocampi TaxID=659824 RepID=A0A7I9ZMZ0_9MYCO|nr:coniferyl-alcohol dehydrogenase [Mycolicibacterium hippocampi]GFH02335.1 3-alpha-hydroxysteroid dehydrogenase [Mycolicibacterium hippocampi]